MIIRSVTFETELADIELLKEKINADLISLNGWETCLSAEAWMRQDRKTIYITLISKWDNKKDFQAWLKRPEHLQAHRDAEKNKDRYPHKITRSRMEEYDLFE